MNVSNVCFLASCIWLAAFAVIWALPDSLERTSALVFTSVLSVILSFFALMTHVQTIGGKR